MAHSMYGSTSQGGQSPPPQGSAQFSTFSCGISKPRAQRNKKKANTPPNQALYSGSFLATVPIIQSTPKTMQLTCKKQQAKAGNGNGNGEGGAGKGKAEGKGAESQERKPSPPLRASPPPPPPAPNPYDELPFYCTSTKKIELPLPSKDFNLSKDELFQLAAHSPSQQRNHTKI
eukprot:TRINITY_DN22462_c0_g1_i1.p1 TRINITY_DN22462_c0_g1~~TRINITY_DN22462_c0_g1_i1.p1  ORF type:complete len:174 (+),score=31.06 TRINITY_DN22462_c0_g1_i1:141-662(+)